MTSADQLNPPDRAQIPIRMDQLDWNNLRPEDAKYLYETFGQGHWSTKLGLSVEEWRQWMQKERVVTYVARRTDAGDEPNTCTDITTVVGFLMYGLDQDNVAHGRYAGVRRDYRGLGIQGEMLGWSIPDVFSEFQPTKLCTETSTLDSPHALQAYVATGFTVVGTEQRPKPRAAQTQRTKQGEIDLVAFDMDGVLVDSDRVIAGVLAGMSNQLSVALSYEQARKLVTGVSKEDAIKNLKAHNGGSLPEGFVQASEKKIAETPFQAIDGVAEVIESCSVPVCAVSNATPREMDDKLAQARLSWSVPFRFSSLRAHGDGQLSPKPDPAVYGWAAKAMEVEPRRVLAIEDSLIGVQAAVAANMRVVGFTADPTEAAALRAAGAQWVAGSMAEVGKILSELGCAVGRANPGRDNTGTNNLQTL